MPPCAWIALAVTSRPASEAAGLGHRGRLGQPLGVGVGGPRGERGRRARLLGFEQHLRAAVRDGLVGAHGHAELLAVLDVVDGHLERPVADADELGADRHERAVRAPAQAPSPSGSPASPGAHARGRARRVDRRRRGVTSASSALDQAAAAVVFDQHEHVRLGAADHELGGAVDGSCRARRSSRRRRGPAASARAARASPPARSRSRPSRSAGTARARASGRAPRRGSTARSGRGPGRRTPRRSRSRASRARTARATARSSVRARLGVLAHALGLGALGQQLARGALDLALVVGEAEVHA